MTPDQYEDKGWIRDSRSGEVGGVVLRGAVMELFCEVNEGAGRCCAPREVAVITLP